MHLNELDHETRCNSLRLLRQGTAEQHRRIERQSLIQALLDPDLTLARYRFILEGLHVWYSLLESALERSGRLGRTTLLPFSSRREGPAEAGTRAFRVSAGELPFDRETTSYEQYAYIARSDVLALDLAALDEVWAAKSTRSPTHAGTHQCASDKHVQGSAPKQSPGADLSLANEPSHDVTSLPSLASLGEVLGVLYVIEGATQGGRILAPGVEERLHLEVGQATGYFRLFEFRQWDLFRTLARTLLDRRETAPAIEAARQTFASLHQHLDGWAARATAIRDIRGA